MGTSKNGARIDLSKDLSPAWVAMINEILDSAYALHAHSSKLLKKALGLAATSSASCEVVLQSFACLLPSIDHYEMTRVITWGRRSQLADILVNVKRSARIAGESSIYIRSLISSVNFPLAGALSSQKISGYTFAEISTCLEQLERKLQDVALQLSNECDLVMDAKRNVVALRDLVARNMEAACAAATAVEVLWKQCAHVISTIEGQL